MKHLLQIVIVGLTSGALYALVAMSYNIIFATTGILNFAQGQLLMAGTMVGVWLYSDQQWPLFVALLATMAAGAVLAVVEDRLAIRPALKHGHGAMGWVLATLGFGIVLQSGFSLLMGPTARAFPRIIDESPHRIAGAVWNKQQLLLVVTALVVGVALFVFYNRTLIGRALGAIAQDPEAAQIRGIPVVSMASMSFAISGALIAATGFLAAPIIGAAPSIGFDLGLKGFIAAALGGIPHIKGAVFGGFVLGLIEALGADWIGPGYRTTVVFAVLIVILALKPAGVFGRLAVRRV